MNEEEIKELHALWRTFLERWPIERLRSMKLEEYTNIKKVTDDYFCHWLERKTLKLGSIQGGTSSKFGIYLAASPSPKLRNGETFKDGYVWWKGLGQTKEEAFPAVRDAIVGIAEAAQRGELEGKLIRYIGPMVQMKLRFLYQPKPYRLLPIYSHEFLVVLSKKYSGKSSKREDMVQVNLDLREKHHPDGDVFVIMNQLAAEVSDTSPNNGRRYWAGGTSWGEDHKADEFIEKNEWRAGFTKETAKKTTDGKLFLENYPKVQIGDWLAMKGWGGRNDLRIYHVGEVISKNKENFSLSVKQLPDAPLFRGKAPRKGGSGGWNTTLAEVTDPATIGKIFGVTPATDEPTKAMNSPCELNQILYGPPGTGKTYRTIRDAVALIDGKNPDAQSNQRFQELKRQGRIEFITFHQSYSYEDFVEGIRPDTQAGSGEVRFVCKDGIFKRLAVRAAYHCLKINGNPPDCDTGYKEMHAAVHAYFRNGEASGHQLRPREEWPAFVLVIDEINRGNISKILGELITLLEPDKRFGGDNALTVQLPYSGESFAVPGNLYLIGTMNTADKSIALVDVALRRRFHFEELSPDLGLCSKLPEELCRVLEKLNQRIMLRKDRDHRIGHAYFMQAASQADFDRFMENKILPLLAEYFYNDWDGLRYVLGESDNDEGLIRPIEGADIKGRNRWQWYHDAGADASPAEQLMRNYGHSANQSG